MRSRLALLLLAAAPFASADLLVNPTGGSVLGFQPDADDSQFSRPLGGTFTLFGTAITSINVTTNGYLGIGDGPFVSRVDRDLNGPTGLVQATNGPVIAAFYDDLIFAAGTTITDQITSTLYAVTYHSMYGLSDTAAGHTSDFQVALFLADTTIGAFQFHAGDIGISYGGMASTIQGSNFTVGVASAESRTGTASNGAVSQLSSFATLPSGSQFFLYRDFGGDYSVTVEDVGDVPEPATFALAGLGIAGLCLLRRRRAS